MKVNSLNKKIKNIGTEVINFFLFLLPADSILNNLTTENKMYLKLIEEDDLTTLVAEAGFDVIDDTDCGRVRIESDYYHSEIEDGIDDYVTEVEAELIEWLNLNRDLLAEDMNVVYTYDIATKLAKDFRILSLKTEA